MADWGGLYRDNVLSLCNLADGLTDEDLGTTVPGTPAWTVRDVLAHLAGASTDLATGRMDGAPGPEWTARHVSERLGFTVDELTRELREHEETVAESADAQPGPAIV